MPDIGTTLREARMRQRIDISEIESTTKIRAKYLRALENEEWDLLPGPTFVKSFLRTYADTLGLDGKLLIEEYKLHHERLSDVELQPIVPGGRSTRRGGRTRGPRPSVSRGWAATALVLALVVTLFLVGVLGGDDEPSSGTGANRVGTTGTGAVQAGASEATTTPAPKKKPKLARLQVVATGPVYVCLKAAGNRTLVRGVILSNGARQGPFRSSRFRLMLGNSEARLVVDGKSQTVPPVTNGIGYEITPARVRRLARASWPTCPTG